MSGPRSCSSAITKTRIRHKSCLLPAQTRKKLTSRTHSIGAFTVYPKASRLGWLDGCYHRLDGTRNFVPIGQRYDKFKRYETVHIPELNIKIHFLHDPSVDDPSRLRASSRGALSSTTTTCSLVHKDEMYSVMTGKEWSAEAPRFGIPFGSKELCVHIELADDDARPTQYRERLISKQTGDDILPKDFALEVRERMPEWVKEVIRNASP